jgi:branched-chain amino acid transport system ATP-binding protein
MWSIKKMLKIDKLNFSYGDMRVLWDVDLTVRRGEIVTVVGSNGAGKSTLLKAISRLVTPDTGDGGISFRGTDISNLQSHEAVEQGIIHVPEGRKIFPEMTVMENLRMGSFPRTCRKDRERNLDRVFSLFPRLKERKEQIGGTMSGGEQQMLAIARGLMTNPKLLLLDEPSLGLAPIFVKSIFEIISEINREGVTVLLVEQNVFQALRVSHRAYVLQTGRVVLVGEGKALLQDARVKRAFLGM